MRPILNRSPDRLELNALFFQPTYYCGANCKGCYVKARGQRKQAEIPNLLNVFSDFYLGVRGCWANQITISIDELSESGEDLAKDMFMYNFWMGIHRILAQHRGTRNPDDRPEVHMTFRSPRTVFKYMKYYGGNNPTDFNFVVQNLDMVSFSNISILDCSLLDKAKHVTNINFNHLIPGHINSDNIKQYIKDIETVSKVVDSIYLVINKDPQGKELTPQRFREVRSRLAHDIAVINTLREKLPYRVWTKCKVDGCLQDVRRSRRTGYGCSSNVSRFQIWPDGSVSGCPYAWRGIGEGGPQASENILENIRHARRIYDYRERCHLSEIYDSLIG